MFPLFRFPRASRGDDVPAVCESLLLALLDAGGTLNEKAALQLGGPEAIREACRLGYADSGADRWTGLTLTKRGKRAAVKLKRRAPPG